MIDLKPFRSLVDQPRWQNSDMQMALVRSIRY